MKNFSAECDVSVVIPCYRCQETLERAVVSVAGQSLRPAEVILVDDASDDRTSIVISMLKERYDTGWLKDVRLPINMGPGAARNAGWEKAERSYIAFLDADDSWHRDKIKIQFQYMRTCVYVDITGHRCSRFRKAEAFPPLPMQYSVRPIPRGRLLISNRLLIGTVMVKRNIAVRFDPTKRYSEDYHFCLQTICRGYRGEILDLNLSYFYKHSYGDRGLSSHLWQMELGELDTYKKLFVDGFLSWQVLVGLEALSSAKFIIRLLVSFWRRKLGKNIG